MFNVPSSGVSLLRRNIDSVVTADLVLQLERPARIVSKMALLTARPQGFSTTDWAGGVSTTWPGATVVAVGTTSVAIESERHVGK